MKTLELNGYLGGVKARKAKLAPAGMLVVEACRNSGASRTASKRASLRRAEDRAKAAGVQPVPANY